MPYQTTITQKGQVTIPKSIREALHLTRPMQVFVELEEGGLSAKITPAEDFLDVARSVKVKRRTDPMKARAAFESSYERA